MELAGLKAGGVPSEEVDSLECWNDAGLDALKASSLEDAVSAREFKLALLSKAGNLTWVLGDEEGGGNVAGRMTMPGCYERLVAGEVW